MQKSPTFNKIWKCYNALTKDKPNFCSREVSYMIFGTVKQGSCTSVHSKQIMKTQQDNW